MRTQAAALTLAAAALTWALWSGCGSGTGPSGVSTGGAAGQDGAPTDRGVDSAGSGGESSLDAMPDVGLPYPGAEACPAWPGWYRAPGLPAGCFSSCVPDDPKLRVPALKWDARDDWCPGCKWLETSWWPGAGPNDRPVLPFVHGKGAGPDRVGITTHQRDDSYLVGLYEASGEPVFALRGVISTSCGAARFGTGQDGTFAIGYRTGLYSNQRWMLRPADRAAELMSATQPSFTYDEAFTGKDSSGGSWLTADWIADRFTGFLSLANVKTGAASKVNSMPGALPGEYDSAVIVGDTVFVQRYTNKSDWMIIQNGALKPFLGGPNVDIDRFATDGTWMVWNEGSELVTDPSDPSRLMAQRHDLYRSPYTTDPTKVQRQLLVPDTPQFYGYSTLANGHFTDMFFADADSGGALHSDSFVVDVQTGRAWKSDLPQNFMWGKRSYPTATELWGGIMPDLYSGSAALTIARVPYTDMTQIQAAMP